MQRERHVPSPLRPWPCGFCSPSWWRAAWSRASRRSGARRCGRASSAVRRLGEPGGRGACVPDDLRLHGNGHRNRAAVAVKSRFAFAAPIASGLAGLLMLIGHPELARWVAVAAAMAFVGGQRAGRDAAARRPHRASARRRSRPGSSAISLFAAAAAPAAVLPWWFSFLVLTIAAERLEMTRLMRRREGAAQVLYAILGAQLVGCAASAVSAAWGGVLYGLSLTGLAVWLLASTSPAEPSRRRA